MITATKVFNPHEINELLREIRREYVKTGKGKTRRNERYLWVGAQLAKCMGYTDDTQGPRTDASDW